MTIKGPKWAMWADNTANMPNYFVLYDNLEENIRMAEEGDAWAQGLLADRYLKGRGVEQSNEKYAEWIRRAADQGEPQSQFNMGCCYEEGIGVPVNMELAVEWYQKSAEQGYKSAKEALRRIMKNKTKE